MAPAAMKNPITIKHIIMAALMAILAAAVVITVVVVVLSPAHILFSITDARYQLSSTSTSTADKLTLTVAANNTSRRTRVEYTSIFIDVSNSTGPQWGKDYWIRATTDTRILPLHQATWNVTNIYAVVPLVGSFWNAAIVNETSRFRVQITARARFWVGITPTRLYDIKVSFSNITFLPKLLSGGAPVAAPPIECGSG